MWIILKVFIALIYSSTRKTLLFIKNKRLYKGLLSFPYSASIRKGSTFEGHNAIADKSHFSGHMGYGSYISEDCMIEGDIGRFSSIAPGVKTHRGLHPISFPYVSTSPMFFSLKKQNGHTFAKEQMFEEMSEPIDIGNDCWICSNVFILGGVKIGDGAVVCAGSVVTRDVPPYAVVAGVPAQTIKYRYDEDTINFLLRIKWWERPISWIESNWELFNNIELFLKHEDTSN